MRTYGQAWIEGDTWHLKCEPHVAMWAKRVFARIAPGSAGVLKIKNSDAVCRDLQWFDQRFSIEFLGSDRMEMETAAARHIDKILMLNQIIGEGYTPPEFTMALPPRLYQSTAAALYLTQGHLLLADDVGIGKTVSAIAALTDKRTLPACVVTLAHLPRQWEREINRFAPALFTHVIKRREYYPLPTKNGRKRSCAADGERDSSYRPQLLYERGRLAIALDSLRSIDILSSWLSKRNLKTFLRQRSHASGKTPSAPKRIGRGNRYQSGPARPCLPRCRRKCGANSRRGHQRDGQ